MPREERTDPAGSAKIAVLPNVCTRGGEQNMTTRLTERDLNDLPEPTRSKAFELLWLLRESGLSEKLAIELAWRGAREVQGPGA
jgi:hypothetical protein